MNCVDYAINEIVRGGDIPTYILELSFQRQNGNFVDNFYDYVNNNTVEQGIREKVIHAIVLPRCRVQGGMIEVLDLTGSTITHIAQGTALVQVPDFLTGGRKIISVLEVYPGAYNATSGALDAFGDGVGGCGTGGTIGEMQQNVIAGLRSNTSVPTTFTKVQLLGNNSFIVNGIMQRTFSMTAKCILESDDGLSQINPHIYPYFATLCEHAVKSYIYKECRFPANEAVSRAGVTIEGVKDVISDYNDSWKNYTEYFDNVWLSYMQYSDNYKKNETINQSIGRRT